VGSHFPCAGADAARQNRPATHSAGRFSPHLPRGHARGSTNNLSPGEVRECSLNASPLRSRAPAFAPHPRPFPHEGGREKSTPPLPPCGGGVWGGGKQLLKWSLNLLSSEARGGGASRSPLPPALLGPGPSTTAGQLARGLHARGGGAALTRRAGVRSARAQQSSAPTAWQILHAPHARISLDSPLAWC